MSSADHDAPPPPLVIEDGGVNLEDLKKVIHSLAESIKSLKSSGSSSPTDKDAISASVSALLNAKRTYAAANGGIDVEGKPWEEPMSKSEKKRLEKAEAARKKKEAEAGAPAAAGGAGGADANDANRPTEGERERRGVQAKTTSVGGGGEGRGRGGEGSAKTTSDGTGPQA